ncbi:MAG: carboxypeptidase-like regulatory domain-containing protein, partial [Chloroflexota bacterium]
IPNSTFSLAPVRWNGGENGLWYVGISGQPWANGIYDFTIFVDGVARNTASIVIGGAPVGAPVISDVVFGLSDLDGAPLGNGFVLPTGTTASARFIHRNMVDGSEWLTRWFYDGAEVFRTPPDVWRDGPDGAKTVSIQDPAGLVPGQYRLEIYVEGRLAATSDFVIAGAPDGAFPSVFADTHFASADSPEEAIIAPPNNNFVTSVDDLYALFDWQQITPGTRWTVEWYVDNELFYAEERRWQAGLSGENFVMRLTGPENLPDGTYRVDLTIGAVRLASQEALIGIGQLPIDRFADASGVQLNGRIVDNETNKGIPGVTFVLISEDFSVIDFIWDSTQVYAIGTTDRNGEFALDRLMQLSDDTITIPYSVVIQADGYLPIELDGFVVNDETPNPLYLTIHLM